jgi:hypothetical protein
MDLAQGGNIWPAGHIRPAKGKTLALTFAFWLKSGTRDTYLGTMLPGSLILQDQERNKLFRGPWIYFTVSFIDLDQSSEMIIFESILTIFIVSPVFKYR